MRSALPGLSAAVFAVAAAVASGVGGPVGVMLVLLVLVVVLSAGWPTLLGLPTRRGSTTIVALGSAMAVIVVALTANAGDPGSPHRVDDTGYLRWLPPVLAVTVILAFTQQLLRRDLRPRLVESVTGVLSGVVVGVLAAGWMAAALSAQATTLIAVAVAPLVCTSLALTVRGRHPWYAVAVVGAAAAAGAAAGQRSAELPWALACTAGAVVGVIVLSLDRLLGWLPSAASLQARLALGASYVSACGMVPYLSYLTAQWGA